MGCSSYGNNKARKAKNEWNYSLIVAREAGVLSNKNVVDLEVGPQGLCVNLSSLSTNDSEAHIDRERIILVRINGLGVSP